MIASLLLLFSAALGSPTTFSFRLPQDPQTLDWNRAHTSIETHLLLNLMEGLVAQDEEMKIVPALAETWEKSVDGRIYRFTLRPGVVWSDGVPLKAKDFENSWKRVLTASTGASYAYLLFDVEGAEDYFKQKIKDFSKVGIKAINDRVFEVRLSRPIAHFIHLPTFWVLYPIREDLIRKHGTQWTRPKNWVSIGPYILESYDPDSKVVMVQNSRYYGGKSKIDRVQAYIVKEDATALNLFETGKLDFLTDLAAFDLKKFSGRSDLIRFPYLKTGYLGFSHLTPVMRDVHLRKAIAHGIDRNRFGDLLHGGQSAASSFVPEGMEGFDKRLGLPVDIEKAKAELKQSNYKPDSSEPITLLTSNWEKTQLISQFIQGELKKNLGISVNLRVFDHKTFRAEVDKGDFPMFVLSWSADFPDPDNFMSVFLSNSGNNRLKWSSNDYDSKVLLARFLQNPQVRRKLYKEAQGILIEKEAAFLPLFYEPIMALVGPRISKIHINPLNGLYIKKIVLK